MDLLPYFTNTQSGITNKKEEKYGTIKEKRKLKYVVSVVLGGANLKLSGRFVKRHRKGLVHESDTPPPNVLVVKSGDLDFYFFMDVIRILQPGYGLS